MEDPCCLHHCVTSRSLAVQVVQVWLIPKGMRLLLVLVLLASTVLLRLPPGSAAKLSVVLSCDNQSCVFPGLDPCVEYTVLGNVSARSVELQFAHNLTNCDGDEATNEAVTVRAI